MKSIKIEELVVLLKKSQVWAITCILLSMFLSMVFVFYMWTLAAFGALMFAILSIFWIILKQTTAIRLDIRK